MRRAFRCTSQVEPYFVDCFHLGYKVMNFHWPRTRCWEIILKIVHMQIRRQRIYTLPRFTVCVGSIFEIGSTGISSLGGHNERRTECVNRFVAEYRGMPLVSTSVKAVDSRYCWFWWWWCSSSGFAWPFCLLDFLGC